MLHVLARHVMGRIDAWYHRRHRLQAVGQVLLVGRVRYRGPAKVFPDGTVLRPDDVIGQLHFSNRNIAALGEGSTQLIGFRFMRLMLESLQRLAHSADNDPMLGTINVFTGVTWIAAHGDVVGFISEPLPRTWRNWWLRPYFRLLSWTFSPSRRKRGGTSAAPRVYWLTRGMLVQNLDKLTKTAAARSANERAIS